MLYWQRTLGARFYLMPYFFPIILLLTKFESDFFRYLLRLSYYLFIPSILVQLYFILFGLNYGSWYETTHTIYLFDLGGAILLLISYQYRNRKVFIIGLINYLLTLYIALVFGRRGWAIDILILLVAMLIFRIRSNKLNLRRKFATYLSIFFIVLMLSLTFNLIQTNFYIFERGFTMSDFDRSRGTIFEDYFNDFNSVGDWIYGRGINGTTVRTDELLGQGQTIENGFLNILLKGGILYLIPMMIIFLRSAYLGFFKTNNDFTKALATLILFQIIGMVSFGLPDYSTPYVLVWVCVSACYSKDLRMMNNLQFKGIPIEQ
jgi:hypothetical protein